MKEKLQKDLIRLNRWMIELPHGEDMIPIYEVMIREREYQLKNL